MGYSEWRNNEKLDRNNMGISSKIQIRARRDIIMGTNENYYNTVFAETNRGPEHDDINILIFCITIKNRFDHQTRFSDRYGVDFKILYQRFPYLFRRKPRVPFLKKNFNKPLYLLNLCTNSSKFF